MPILQTARVELIQRGFSLIELLVAVFVIVLLTGIVSLNVGRGGADIALESEVRHVAGLLGFASAEAGLSATDHGFFLGRSVEPDASSYRGIWLSRFDQGWAAPRTGVEVFSPVRLAVGYELRLELDGQPDVDIMPYDPELNPTPQIVVWAGGEITPGSLEWWDARTGDLLYRLEWDLLGRMTLMPNGRAADE
jgi:general secretion pathway protein H